MLLVADFTYVRLASGVFVYAAFAIDAYAGRIVGWTCSTSKTDAFVRRAIRHAAELRNREGNPLSGRTIHHSDAGSQYTSVRFGETLSLSGLVASIGSVGDAYDNALAETTIGLYKTEAVRDDAPFRRGPCTGWPTSSYSPPTGCTGTTPAGSCTASAESHQRSTKPPTTINKPTLNRWHTSNRVCTKPGMLLYRVKWPLRADVRRRGFGRAGG